MIGFCIAVIVLGIWFVVSALANWDWFYGIMEFGIIEGLFGEGAGRAVCLICGVGLIIGGIVGCFGGR